MQWGKPLLSWARGHCVNSPSPQLNVTPQQMECSCLNNGRLFITTQARPKRCITKMCILFFKMVSLFCQTVTPFPPNSLTGLQNTVTLLFIKSLSVFFKVSTRSSKRSPSLSKLLACFSRFFTCSSKLSHPLSKSFPSIFLESRPKLALN